MKTYLFQTTTTMKEYNSRKYWINSDYVTSRMKVNADTLKEALLKYRERVQKENYVEISNNAMKKKEAMYIDTPNGAKQVGYIITGKTEFEDEGNHRWTMQYIDLWINISIVNDVDFDEFNEEDEDFN